MNAGQLCNRQVVVAAPELPVLEAAQLMRDHHVGDVVVVEPCDGENEPVGILTDRDLVLEVLAGDVGTAEERRVFEVMTSELVTATEDEDASEVLRRMRAYGVRRMPIVNHRGTLEGILTYDDLLEWFVDELADLVHVVDRGARAETARASAKPA